MLQRTIRWMQKHKVQSCFIGLSVLAATAFAIWLVSSTLTFNNELNKARQQTKTALTAAATKLKDVKTADMALEQLEKLKEAIHSVRVDDSSYLLTGDQRLRLKDIDAKKTGLYQACQHEIDYLRYQVKLAAQIATASKATGNNQTELNAMASSWQGSATSINKMEAPTKAREFHIKLEQKVQQISDTVAALATSYQKMDGSTYATKKQQFTAQIGELQKLHVESKAAAKVYDQELAGAMRSLNLTLQ